VTHCCECGNEPSGSTKCGDFYVLFLTWLCFDGEELLASRPTPKLEDHSLSAVRDCLFIMFTATLRIRRPFVFPVPEDAPWRGDTDAIITECEPVLKQN
jgi:hypothetical protein